MKTRQYNIELKLIAKSSEHMVNLSSIDAVAKFLDDKITHLDREHFVTICVDTKNNVMGWEITGIGAVNTAAVSFREIFKLAIMLNATGVIVAHNHPSGTLDISKADIKLTKSLMKSGELFQIDVMDHVIVCVNGSRSVVNYIRSKEKKHGKGKAIR